MKITRTLTRDLPNRDRVVVELELRIADNGERLVDGISPCFSATYDIYEARRNASGAARQRMGREADGGGTLGDEMVRHFPEAAPIVALHLSDPDGVPMHAEANGWYWYSSYDGQGTHNNWDNRTDYDVACDYLRMPAIPGPQNRRTFGELVDAQRSRWAVEAHEARALLESLPEE